MQKSYFKIFGWWIITTNIKYQTSSSRILQHWDTLIETQNSLKIEIFKCSTLFAVHNIGERECMQFWPSGFGEVLSTWDGEIASLAMVTLDGMVNDVGSQFPQPSTFSGTVMAKMKMQRFFFEIFNVHKFILFKCAFKLLF